MSGGVLLKLLEDSSGKAISRSAQSPEKEDSVAPSAIAALNQCSSLFVVIEGDANTQAASSYSCSLRSDLGAQ